MTIEIGQEAPDFELKDQAGNTVTLSGFRGDKAVALVFYPFTFTGVEKAGVQVLAMSCDSRHSQRVWAEQQGYQFPVLSDFWPHGAVARAYGVFNDAVGCANRATFLLATDGVVSSTFSSPDLGTPRARAEYEDALAKVS